MLEVETTADLMPRVGQPIGTSDWLVIDQTMIDMFAEATGDHQWIHVDVERAKTDMPGGHTIAHGFLTLSLIPRMAATIMRVRQRSRALNYGSNKVRFTAPVPSGSRVRLHQTLQAVEPVEGGKRLIMACSIEVENQPRPALVAETITVIYD